jgi:hypothetical protein
MYIVKHILSNLLHVNNFDMYKMWQIEFMLAKRDHVTPKFVQPTMH